MKHGCAVIFLILSWFISSVWAAPKPVVCDQEYALCTSAPCIVDPRHPDMGICSCDVLQGNSVGYKTCEQRQPKNQALNTKQVISTFSFEQFSTKKSMVCKKGKPWTDCVDAPCTVNPMDPTKAICSCKINHDQVFQTFGGQCDAKTCDTGFWSGATPTAGAALRGALLSVTTDKSQAINEHCEPAK